MKLIDSLAENIHLFKVAASIFIATAVCTCSTGCGFAIGDSVQLSTVSWQQEFNKGRTATHEVGHYLDLRHIWGDTADCSGSDQVADTPNCAGPNFGMPAFPTITCNNGPNGDMFVNYMDYTDDAAMFMMTTQQVVRMRATLDTARSGLV